MADCRVLLVEDNEVKPRDRHGDVETDDEYRRYLRLQRAEAAGILCPMFRQKPDLNPYGCADASYERIPSPPVYPQVRACRAMEAIPIIAMTVNTFHEDVVKAYGSWNERPVWASRLSAVILQTVRESS